MNIESTNKPGNKSTESLFQIRGRFARSAQLERDWHDAAALRGYVLTEHGTESLERLSEGLSPRSSARAWRITGDYGSGKSSFALLLAHLFSSKRNALPASLRGANRRDRVRQPELLPILVTGAREPLSVAVLRALASALTEAANASQNPETLVEVIAQLQTVLRQGEIPSDSLVMDLIGAAQVAVEQSRCAQGMLLILDEMGKFLEYAAMHPDRQDIYLLQSLAEAASRSGNSPFFVVGLLHQGFSAYTDALTPTGQREWEKVAGRYEEVSWNHPIEQIAALIAEALNVQQNLIPQELRDAAALDMDEALSQKWYGPAPSEALRNLATRIFPLHPTVLPPLVRLFARFGQNERSLFTFLLGDEPFGLRDFVARTNGREFFRLSDLFDYARSAFGYQLSLQSYRSHWNALDSVISTYNGGDKLELHLLKSVAVLNALDSGDLLARQLLLILAAHGLANDDEILQTLRRLKTKHYLYSRGIDGGYSLWPHTSVNLNRAYEDAKRETGQITHVSSLLPERLDARPLVARRHYIQTGNLRHFDVIYCSVDDLPNQVAIDTIADGCILIPLCETPEEERRALEFAASWVSENSIGKLLAVPSPLQGQSGVLNEVRYWEWVERHTPELEHDLYAREEVRRQLTAAQIKLDDSLQMALGLANGVGAADRDESGLRWFYRGVLQEEMASGREIMGRLSDICDERFRLAPRIKNELINRRNLSSAAAAARMRLIERLFSSADQPLLGMDATKKPPEMSVYLSVLRAAGLHRIEQNGEDLWNVGLPEEAFDGEGCNVLPVLQHLHAILMTKRDQRVVVTEVFEALRQPPYGVRDGLNPLLLAVFSVVYEPELAFYEDGTFLPRLDGDIFVRLTKAPESFHIQLCPLTGVRSDLFRRLVRALNIAPKTEARIDVLDIVKPLFLFTAKLPEYTIKTSKLTTEALAVRDALVTAREPTTLLWNALPLACGLNPFVTDSEGDESEEFAVRLKSAVDELRGAYPALLDWVMTALQAEFGLSGSFLSMQMTLAPRARTLLVAVTEPRLRSFCLRLADTNMVQDAWLESLGSMVSSMPPAKWRDAERHRYESEIHTLCAQFKRVEAATFGRANAAKTQQDVEALRLALTQADGNERQSVVWLASQEQEEAASLEKEIAALIQKKGRVGVAATTRALWRILSESENV